MKVNKFFLILSIVLGLIHGNKDVAKGQRLVVPAASELGRYCEAHHCTLRELEQIGWHVIEVGDNVTRKLSLANNDCLDRQNPVLGNSRKRDLPTGLTNYLDNIGVEDVWRHSQGLGTTIALIDTGIAPDHPDLQGNILWELGYDFADNDENPWDNHGHGTMMAGLICGGGGEVAGLAPDANIIPYKIVKDSGVTFLTSDLTVAILAAADSSAAIINLSLVVKERTAWLDDALQYARQRGKIIVAAAGNAGGEVSFPAKLPWVIAVGALDTDNDTLVSTSNYGENLTITAPGRRLLSTTINQGYEYISGTSASVALVSGALAIAASLFPDLPPGHLISKLLMSAEDAGLPGRDLTYGFGKLQLTNLADDQDDRRGSMVFLSPQSDVLMAQKQLGVDLSLLDVVGKEGDLYLQLTMPTTAEGKWRREYIVGQGMTVPEPVPLNAFIASPYYFDKEIINWPLFGSDQALMGDGSFDQNTVVGPYELAAALFLSDGSLDVNRLILWLEP